VAHEDVAISMEPNHTKQKQTGNWHITFGDHVILLLGATGETTAVD
jgi:hypothetical protein